MMKRILRFCATVFIVVFLVIIVGINLRLYHSPETEVVQKDTVDSGIVKELYGLQHALANHADVEMQTFYPEGYVFLNAIYGLAWCRFLESVDTTNALFKNGHSEVARAWTKINSRPARALFSEDLPLSHGAYYMGWNNYLLGSKLQLETESNRDQNEMAQFKSQSKQIAESITETIYPPSYHGASWPADVMTCVASLALHDKLFAREYDSIIHKWIHAVKINLDSNGLIPHAADSETGKSKQDARGSSQSLMLIFLNEIDSAFARQQFQRYRAKFIQDKFGLTGIREYPKGVQGKGDIDSGPVLLEMGAAATIVGMKTLAIYGDRETSIRIRNEIETAGIPTESGGHKKYLFGMLPIADAFIVWSHTEIPREANKENVWFGDFHVISLIVVAIFSTLLWILWKNSFKRSTT